jgi:dTMP kinase
MNKYFVFEGIDGSGKTTLAKYAKEYLIEQGFDVIHTKEPGSPLVPVCKAVREIIIKNKMMSQEAVSCLFAADGFEHKASIVEPMLDSGYWVIQDREFNVSDFCYRGDFRIQQFFDARECLFKAYRHDSKYNPVIVYVSCPVQIALPRILARGTNRFEDDEVIPVMQRIHDRYEKIIFNLKSSGEIQVVVIDNGDNLSESKKQVRLLLEANFIGG